MNQRIIRVSGSATVSETPDWVNIHFSLESNHINYKQCLDQLAEQVESLRNELSFVGVEKESLKTTSFNINTDFERVKSNYVFKGYTASHDIQVEFSFDKNQLNEVLNALSRSDSQSSFRISFSVKDKEILKNKAMALAVKNAKEKARILAESAEVLLGDILQIDYSWSEMRIQSSMDLSDMSYASAPANYDIAPSDIDVTETVTVVWLLV